MMAFEKLLWMREGGPELSHASLESDSLAQRCGASTLATVMRHRYSTRQHTLAEVACYRLERERTLMGCVSPSQYGLH